MVEEKKKKYNMYVRNRLVKKNITRKQASIEFEKKEYNGDASFELKLSKN